ncbi:MAG: TIGR03016 family PEP-CTERM system-associated outer membrane protein, partial [Rhodothermales bacterium]|nr:TIGR03016 family PEP-CTERM system-associated outer membrane protein [Rhodothermales bacterium]
MVLFVSQAAAAAPWEFETIIDVDVIRTDNLTLAPAGLEEGETLYRVASAFLLTTEGQRLTANIHYRPQGTFYTDVTDSNEVYHSVDASGTLSLVKDALFFYASALNFQSFVSPEGEIPSTNIPLSENRIDSRILEVRPYWEQDLGFANILLGYQYIDTSFDEIVSSPTSLEQNNNERIGTFNLNNHRQERGFAWGLEYEHRRLNYETAIPWEFQQAKANLGFWVNGVTRVFVSGGLESPFDSFVDSSLEEETWEVGFQYKPNQRLDLEIAGGERSFGKSYRARMGYQLRRGQMQISYVEQPASQGQFANDRRPQFLIDSLQGLLNRPGATDRFVQRRADWTTDIELTKSELSFRLYWDDRDQRTTDAGSDLEDESLVGANVRWAWNLGTKSQVGFDVDAIKLESGRSEDDVLALSVDYSYRLSQRYSV